MALKCGIVGLPNVGKSTLFNALSNAKAQSANFPFCTIEPNVGVITVPDPRLNKLQELIQPKSLVPTTIEFVDIAGLVKGASKGEGLGNQFLGNIRETDAVIHVVRCFDDDNIVHVHGGVDPIRDKEIIDTELLFKDLEGLEKRLDKQRRAAKSGDKAAQKLVSMLDRLKTHIEQGIAVRMFECVDEEERSMLQELQLLTAKPVLYACNVSQKDVLSGNAYVEKIRAIAAQEEAEVVVICAGIEAEIAELESLEDRAEFLADLGLEESGLNRLIRSAYKLLDLVTYFTAGVKEVRAWTIRRGTKAPQAAGVIHSDFEKGFIRAEVIPYATFFALGSEAACKEAGKLQVEGKEYVVQDGDVMHFRFNV